MSADWVGVYMTVPPSIDGLTAAGGDGSAPNLLKLAYVGSISRPYFPLTAEFAESSNNSTVRVLPRAPLRSLESRSHA